MEKQERKMLRICDLSLATGMTFGYDATRDRIWEEVLREAELIVADELPLSAKGIRKGKREVRSLKSSQTAAEAGKVQKNMFEHLYRTRLRVYIACAIEDAIPGKWTCVWSNTRVREICYALHNILETVLLSRSRLLQSLPTAAVVAFLQCVREFDNCLSAEWWVERSNQKMFIARALEYAFEVLDVSSLPKEYTTSIKRASFLFRLTFLHLSAVTDDFSAQGFMATRGKIEKLLETVSNGDLPKGDGLNPVYFTESEIQEVLKSVAGLEPTFARELNYIFSLQKTALQNCNSEAIGNYCYLSNEKGEQPKKGTNELGLYTMDAFLFDAAVMLSDLNAVPLKFMKEPHRSTSQDILFELGQPRVGSIYQLNYIRLFAIVELFGGAGIQVEMVNCESLAREIGEKLTRKGRFSTKRTRILVTDPRLRRRTPQMLREPRPLGQLEESESDVSDSDSEGVEERETEVVQEVVEHEPEDRAEQEDEMEKENVDQEEFSSDDVEEHEVDDVKGKGRHDGIRRSKRRKVAGGSTVSVAQNSGAKQSSGSDGSANRSKSAHANEPRNEEIKRTFRRFRTTASRSCSRSRSTVESWDGKDTEVDHDK